MTLLKKETAIILGNGPSLKGFDFSSELDGLTTFGLNVAFRYWNKINWYPSYYSCLDPAVCECHKESIWELIKNKKENGIKKFILRANAIHFYQKMGYDMTDVINFDFWHIRNKFTKFFSKFLTTGALTTLWAASLGFKNIILLGIDANFPCEKLSEADAIDKKQSDTIDKNRYSACLFRLKNTPQKNENYFFDDYQKKDDFYYMADKKKYSENQIHILSWEFIPNALENFHTTVINANPKSNINIFPKIAWEDVKTLFT